MQGQPDFPAEPAPAIEPENVSTAQFSGAERYVSITLPRLACHTRAAKGMTVSHESKQMLEMNYGALTPSRHETHDKIARAADQAVRVLESSTS